MRELHIELTKDHTAFRWLETQADKIGARGHIGTHLDCYTTVPSESEYLLPVHILDCRSGMPDTALSWSLPDLSQKVLVLYTGNQEQHGYGSEAYFATATHLTEEVVGVLLSKHPSFIVIDSHGIGEKGGAHIFLDKLCESCGCHVIENANITSATQTEIQEIRIVIDTANPSTGKPCKLYY